MKRPIVWRLVVAWRQFKVLLTITKRRQGRKRPCRKSQK